MRTSRPLPAVWQCRSMSVVVGSPDAAGGDTRRRAVSTVRSVPLFSSTALPLEWLDFFVFEGHVAAIWLEAVFCVHAVWGRASSVAAVFCVHDVSPLCTLEQSLDGKRMAVACMQVPSDDAAL